MHGMLPIPEYFLEYSEIGLRHGERVEQSHAIEVMKQFIEQMYAEHIILNCGPFTNSRSISLSAGTVMYVCKQKANS